MAEEKNEAAEEAAVEQPAKKVSKKLLLIIVAAVVVLAGAGGGAYFFLQGGDEEATAEADAPADPKDKKGKNAKNAKNAKSKKEEKPKAPPVYVKLEPPFVSNFESKGMVRFLQVSVEVMTRDPMTAEQIKANDPMIRNDLLLLFGSQQYEAISTREGKEKLRNDALSTVAKIVASEGGDAKKVEQLYFTSFVMQ